MDEPGRLPHAWPRKSPRRVQPDRPRLQSATGAQYSWRRSHDARTRGLKVGSVTLYRPITAFSAPLMSYQAANSAQTTEFSYRSPLATVPFNYRGFSHGL